MEPAKEDQERRIANLRVLRGLLLPLMLLTTSTAAAAPRVTISVVSAKDGSGVQSRLWQRIGNAEVETATDATGRKTFEPLACSPNVSFKIKPYHPLYIYPTEWQSCQPNLVIQIRPVGYAESLAEVLQQTPTEVTQLASSGPEGAKALPLETRFRAAANDGSWGEMAFYANELAALLRSVDEEEAANVYSAIAIESGGRAIVAEKEETVDDPLLSTQGGRFLFESKAANNVLSNFQTEKGLARTGRWDYQTFEAIRDLDENNLSAPE